MGVNRSKRSILIVRRSKPRLFNRSPGQFMKPSILEGELCESHEFPPYLARQGLAELVPPEVG